MDTLYADRTEGREPFANTGLGGNIRAVERAVDVLDALAAERGALSVTDLERMLGLSRPTLYRLLRTLESKGLVRSFGTPLRYALGPRVVALGGAWLAGDDLVSAAQSHIARLWRETDETVALFVRASPVEKLCVQELTSRQALVFTRGAGFSEPMTAGASGKVMLAHMPTDDIEPVLAAVADDGERAALMTELGGIRRRGHCVSIGSIIAGAISIAAPVFDAGGRVTASICLFGPEVRLDEETRERIARRVMETAATVSAALGHRPGLAAE